MKEIKFRAFLKDSAIHKMGAQFIVSTGRIFDVDIIDFQKTLIGIKRDTIYGFDFADVELLQYTGSKDKDGREIYEGDILDTGYDFERAAVGHGDYEFEYGTSDGDEDYNATMCAYGWHFGNSRLGKYCDVKIIGNIYENPELLNEP